MVCDYVFIRCLYCLLGFGRAEQTPPPATAHHNLHGFMFMIPSCSLIYRQSALLGTTLASEGTDFQIRPASISFLYMPRVGQAPHSNTKHFLWALHPFHSSLTHSDLRSLTSYPGLPWQSYGALLPYGNPNRIQNRRDPAALCSVAWLMETRCGSCLAACLSRSVIGSLD